MRPDLFKPCKRREHVRPRLAGQQWRQSQCSDGPENGQKPFCSLGPDTLIAVQTRFRRCLSTTKSLPMAGRKALIAHPLTSTATHLTCHLNNHCHHLKNFL